MMITTLLPVPREKYRLPAPLGAAAFDYTTEAIRLAHKAGDWTYVLVTFGAGGSAPMSMPVGDRADLDKYYREAVADTTNVYVGKFDKTEDDFEPIEELLVESPFGSTVGVQRFVAATGLVSKIKKYAPYAVAIGGALALVHFVTGALKKRSTAAT